MISDILYFILFIVVLLLLSLPLSHYIKLCFQDKTSILDKFFLPLENIFYRLTGIDYRQSMNWRQYTAAVIWFNIWGVVFLCLLQAMQAFSPFNPENMPAVPSWDLIFNTAVSFMTNTNWQAYSGESTMSYLTQMAGLAVQNFLSAATGLAVAIALIRGITRRTGGELGNFWVDLLRGVTRILLPLSIIFALILIQQGVIQNLSPYSTFQTITGNEQTLAMGPVASQEAIKLLGTNGGGFFNANSAHPFENPTALTNFLEALSIFLIPCALVLTFGRMTGDNRQGYAVLGSMLLLFVMMLGVLYVSEYNGNPLLAQLNISPPTAMEGKELRFGIAGTSLFATVTTAASCGAVNAMHDSLTPISGLITLLQMQLGEVVLGGVGAGFYGMLLYVFFTVFIVGLMVGRTPEYLGKKIEAFEMKMATLAILIPSVVILLGSSIAVIIPEGVASIANPGPHGLSEVLYAFSSGAGNNGSAFAGLNANTPFYNISLALAMLLGRFGIIIPIMAIAGNMATKKISPANAGTFNTNSTLFMLLLTGIVFVVGALTFIPALALGPVLEQLTMINH